MHARVTKFTVEPGRVDDATEYYRSTVLPQARELEGFKGGVALIDRDGGSIFSFTLWENEEAMRASEEVGNRLRGKAASDLQFPAPVVERFEVGVLEID
jgi:heme-degrading monooxygenase HmoA